MSRRIWLINGWNVQDGGENTVLQLRNELEEMKIPFISKSYCSTYSDLFNIKRLNKKVVKDLIKEVEESDVIICHSNGAAIAVEAASKSDKIKRLVLVQPALVKNYQFPDTLERVDVFHNKGDWAVKLGKWLRRITRFKILSNNYPDSWGEMGNTGYTGSDSRVFNHQLCSNLGHSGVWSNEDMNKLIVLAYFWR